MLFGWTSAGNLRPPRCGARRSPVRLVSLGGDVHRDWGTLLSAFAGKPGFELVIASSKARVSVKRGVGNVRVKAARSEAEVRALYDWADVAVVAMKENRHASGITVILEAVASGVPVVATDTGGLRDYFSEGEVCYVPVGDARALREAARQLALDGGRRAAMAAAAQRRLIEAGLTSAGFALRHRELAEELLGRRSLRGRARWCRRPLDRNPRGPRGAGRQCALQYGRRGPAACPHRLICNPTDAPAVYRGRSRSLLRRERAPELSRSWFA